MTRGADLKGENVPSNSVVIQEMIVDAIKCRAQLSEKTRLLALMHRAAEAVGATVIESHCTEYEPYGATLVVLLAESHILLSTWPEYDYVTINIFLCNEQMAPADACAILLDDLRPARHIQRTFRHVICAEERGIIGRRVFLAAPFTGHICPITCVVADAKRGPLQMISERLRAKGAQVFLAHERENWGGALLAPLDCALLDFREIQASDVLVAVVNPPSYGVCVELGWASALQLPVILLDESGEGMSCTPLVKGLNGVTRCIAAKDMDEVIKALSNLAADAAPGSRAACK